MLQDAPWTRGTLRQHKLSNSAHLTRTWLSGTFLLPERGRGAGRRAAGADHAAAVPRAHGCVQSAHATPDAGAGGRNIHRCGNQPSDTRTQSATARWRQASVMHHRSLSDTSCMIMSGLQLGCAGASQRPFHAKSMLCAHASRDGRCEHRWTAKAAFPRSTCWIS
jgi:hypothetical protein